MRATFLLLPLAGLLFAAEEPAKAPARPGLEITSSYGEFDLKKGTAYYSNNVVVVDPPAKPGDPPTTVRCHELKATRVNGQIEAIEAIGFVEIDQGDLHARGGRVVYTGSNQWMTLTGPFAHHPGPILYSSAGTNRGDLIIYDRKIDKLYISNVVTEVPNASLQNEKTNQSKSIFLK